MYDIHNHLLPGVDDGPSNMRISLSMIEQAIKQGITHIACTSHVNDRSEGDIEKLFSAKFAELKGKVSELKWPIELCLGSEIMFGAELKKLFDYKFSTYGNKGQYFLLEFPIQTPYEIMVNAIKITRKWDKRPVIAHIERFSAIKDTDQVAELKKLGAVISIDAGALWGQFGNKLLKTSKAIVSSGLADILTSDAHNDEEQQLCLKRGFEHAAELLDFDKARKLVLDNPRIVWNSEPWPEESQA